MKNDVGWLETLLSETHAIHAILPDGVPSTLLDLLNGEFDAGPIKPARRKEIADSLLGLLTDDKKGNDANSRD